MRVLLKTNRSGYLPRPSLTRPGVIILFALRVCPAEVAAWHAHRLTGSHSSTDVAHATCQLHPTSQLHTACGAFTWSLPPAAASSPAASSQCSSCCSSHPASCCESASPTTEWGPAGVAAIASCSSSAHPQPSIFCMQLIELITHRHVFSWIACLTAQQIPALDTHALACA